MKKLLKIKNLFIILILIMVLSSLSFMNKASATSTDDAVLCTISEEYKEWEKLSDKEKETAIMPPMCDSEADDVIYRYFSFDVQGTLPASFDGRKQSYAASIKNQRDTGGCWAFSATTALETYSEKKLNLTQTYSTRHIEYSSTRNFLNGAINDHGYNREVGSGGNYYMTSNYLINGYGPISEAEMPFINNENMISISEIQNKNTLLDVNNVVLKDGTIGDKCTESEKEDIKKYVLENGSVMVTTYISSLSTYYNSKTAAYYYNGNENINHAVTIVGWDDNYSKTNFSSSNRPSSNGAWIVQNSYGTSFGENGYYYISYEDVHTCDFYMVIDDVDTEIEDNSYIYDKLGYISYMGYGTSTDTSNDYTIAYAMNIFKKESGKEENLKEITFGTTGTGTYKIYYKQGKANSISTMTEIGSGEIPYSGYITHKLDNPILLDEEVTDFSIAIFYDMDTNTRPVAVSVASSTKYKYISIDKGQSFISYDGKNWTDLSTRNYATIASIKAFTDDIDHELTLDKYEVSYDNDISVKLTVTSRNIDYNNLKIVVKDSSNTEITPNTISYTNQNNTLKYINLTLSNSLKNDTYTFNVYYKNNYIGNVYIPINTEAITSSLYTIDQNNLILYVSPKTNISTFKSNIFNSSNIVYKDTSTVTSGYVSTGMKIDNYLIIVKGDVTGDGLVNIADVIKIADHTIKQNVLVKESEKVAAEVTNDEIINIADVIKVADYTLDNSIALWR